MIRPDNRFSGWVDPILCLKWDTGVIVIGTSAIMASRNPGTKLSNGNTACISLVPQGPMLTHSLLLVQQHNAFWNQMKPHKTTWNLLNPPQTLSQTLHRGIAGHLPWRSWGTAKQKALNKTSWCGPPDEMIGMASDGHENQVSIPSCSMVKPSAVSWNNNLKLVQHLSICMQRRNATILRPNHDSLMEINLINYLIHLMITICSYFHII